MFATLKPLATMPRPYSVWDLAQTKLPCQNCEPNACITKSNLYPGGLSWLHAACLNEVLKLVSSVQHFYEVLNSYFLGIYFMFNIKYAMTLGVSTHFSSHGIVENYTSCSFQWHLIAYKLF